MTGAARLNRVAVAAAWVLAAVVLDAGPASAHTLTGVPPTNYHSEILAIDPPLPGVHLQLLDLGRRIRLTNSSPDEVVVLGYQREPYFLVGPQGVFENRHSPSAYKNRVPVGPTTATTLPPEADASARPDWHRISTGTRVTWRDQRTRWEGSDPPEVRHAPQLSQVVVPTWTIELRKGDMPVLVEGRLTWVPGPSPWPWMALALGLAAGCAALARCRRWGPALSGCVAALVAVDVVRNVGVALATGDSTAAVAFTVLVGGLLSVAAWVVGAWCVDALQRQRGAVAAGAVGLFIAVFSLSDLPVLTRSQVPQAFSSTFARGAVAGSLGLGVGLVLAAVIVERRIHPVGAQGRSGLARGTKRQAGAPPRPDQKAQRPPRPQRKR